MRKFQYDDEYSAAEQAHFFPLFLCVEEEEKYSDFLNNKN